MILAVALVGMAAIAGLGLFGRRRPSASLEEWTVGGRNFGSVVTWFLLAGDIFTTFTFLAVAGLAFIGLYFIAPRVWRLGKEHGYLTQADFFAERYHSPLLGKLVALVGVVFMLPYLQLQITGLGLMVQLVTGSANSGHLCMVVATVLVVIFVLWAGIHGLAKTSYLKDGLMIFAMVVLIVAVPVHYVGGIRHVFHEIARHDPKMLTIHAGPHDAIWWVTSVLISMTGVLFCTVPHTWPGMLAARSDAGLRRNFTWLPLYQVVIIFPVIIGFTGALVLSRKTSSNGVLLTLAHGALPDWLTGVVAVAAAASAMIPAASMLIAISTAVAKNLLPVRSERGRLAINHVSLVAVAALALILGIARPNALANLLLLTFSGMSQLAPALVAALGRRRRLDTVPAVLGIMGGVGVVAWLTFDTSVDIKHASPGVIGLVLNIVVAAVAQAVVNLGRGRTPVVESATEKAGVPA